MLPRLFSAVVFHTQKNISVDSLCCRTLWETRGNDPHKIVVLLGYCRPTTVYGNSQKVADLAARILVWLPCDIGLVGALLSLSRPTLYTYMVVTFFLSISGYVNVGRHAAMMLESLNGPKPDSYAVSSRYSVLSHALPNFYDSAPPGARIAQT